MPYWQEVRKSLDLKVGYLICPSLSEIVFSEQPFSCLSVFFSKSFPLEPPLETYNCSNFLHIVCSAQNCPLSSWSLDREKWSEKKRVAQEEPLEKVLSFKLSIFSFISLYKLGARLYFLFLSCPWIIWFGSTLLFVTSSFLFLSCPQIIWFGRTLLSVTSSFSSSDLSLSKHDDNSGETSFKRVLSIPCFSPYSGNS